MATYEQTVDSEFLLRLRQYVRRRVPTLSDADDVVQDALVKLLHKGQDVAPASARAWLFTVARNLILDRWRSPRREREGLAGDEAAAAAESDREVIAYLAQCLEPMLETMAEQDRELLRRVDILEESQAQIARGLSLSASVVKSRVQRARRRLRELLEGCCAVERDRRGTPIAYERLPGGSCAPECNRSERDT